MKITRGIALTSLIATAMTLGATTSFSQDACDHGGNHRIQVEVGANDSPELSYRGGSAENVYVCLGDEVQWVLTGSDRSFFVEFFGGAPFAGAEKRGSSGGVVSVTIGGPAESGNSYDYNVEFADGGALDPRIIVE